jgi:hypothetical protein
VCAVGAVVAVLAVVLAVSVVLITRLPSQTDARWHLARTSELTGAQSVSCLSFSNCWAVGYDRVERLSGGASASAPIPALGGDQATELFGVACPTADECWAVGQDETTEQLLLAHEVDGGWTLTVGAGSNIEPRELNAVTCVAPNDCWAVGDVGPIDGTTFQPLIEQYSGTGWSVIGSPTLGTGGDLTAVTCVGPSQCWAVGTIGGEEETDYPWIKPLIEAYSGGRWTVSTSPARGGSGGLSGVTCPAAEDC